MFQPHALSVTFFFGQVFGYIALSTAMQVVFYRFRKGDEDRWKIQPKAQMRVVPQTGSSETLVSSRSTESNVAKPSDASHLAEDAADQWWLPALSLVSKSRPCLLDRHPRHALFCTINLCMASAFLALTVEFHLRGWSQLGVAVIGGTSTSLFQGLPLLKAVAAQTLVEYYWHRLMHWPPCYKGLHKLHHYYKSPRPFDDLFIHPLEAFGYYLILYILPTFCLGPMPVGDFVVYMALHGVCGVIDHCGVDLRLGRVYAASDHDAHHQHFNVNYGFPFVIMDIIHGTAHSDAGCRSKLR